MRIKNPTAYLAILENNPNGADLLELDGMIAGTETFLNHPNVHPTMKVALERERVMLVGCRDDLSHGRENAFWNKQKVKAQKAIDEEIAEALEMEALES